VFNPTWFYVGVLYALGVWKLEVPKRVAVFFYALVFVFLYLPLTQDYVNLPVDFLKTLPPWAYTSDGTPPRNGQINDLTLQIIPWAHQVRESWKSLDAPLWNPFSASGYPLLANLQSSALSPLRILELPLSLGHAMTFEAAMKILIALTFTFLWCRRRGYSEIASVIGATAFGFSTFIIAWLHFPLITTACFVPAVFYLIDLLAERITYPRFVAAAAVWAVMLFGGHPETASHTFFLAFLYVLWIVAVERTAKWKLFLTLGGAMVIAALLAAPVLVPFAEAVTKSKRYQELAQNPPGAEVPHSDWRSTIALFQPKFFNGTHAEAISGFAGYLGVAAWFALLAHVIAKRKWRSREMFFVIATLIVLGVILQWPVISDVFHLVFRLAANARMRLMLALLMAVQSAALVDLIERDKRSVLIGIGCAFAMLLAFLPSAREGSMLAIVPSVIVLMIAILVTRYPQPATLFLVVAIVAELWEAGGDWNPVVPNRWLYPKTPLIEKLDALTKNIPSNQPYRIAGKDATLFPNTSAVYGYEDVRAHDPMVNGRYVGLLRVITNYDTSAYFAPWVGWEKRFIDFLNVRYIVTPADGELPPRYRLVYNGFDGRIFENPDALPRFYAVRNVVIEFNDAAMIRRLGELEGWSHTALLDELKVESRQMHDDFFRPRRDDAPVATAEILEASPTRYRLHVKAPRYSLVASSVPWWPGWKVERNGARVDPIRVNGGFLGFAVPQGELDVEVWYDPWSFRLGAIIAALTAVVLIGIGSRRYL